MKQTAKIAPHEVAYTLYNAKVYLQNFEVYQGSECRTLISALRC
jgi:hypothetical protein